MKLDNREVKDFGVPYVIAEIGSNHNGDMDLAKRLVDEAKACGCDAAKFQSWTPESLICREEYDRNQKSDDTSDENSGSLKEMVEKYYLRRDQHIALKAHCDQADITFLSTPFSTEEVDLLEEVCVPFYKIASMDIDNLQFLEYIAKKNKPIVLSTGMATLSEIDIAVKTIEAQGNSQIILLHCIAIYPPAYEDINLNNITMLRKTFGYPIGFSDHSLGTAIPLASVALGACVIEKHFTLDKDMSGWDHSISADPQDMRAIVEGTCSIATALGSYKRVVGICEQEKKLNFRRSAVAKNDLKQGTVLKSEDVSFKRPGTGIPPNEVQYIVGCKLKRNISQDGIIQWDDMK